MINRDFLQKLIFVNASIKGAIVRLTDSYQKIVSQHAYPGIISHLMGEMLAVVCLVVSGLKFKGRVSVQFQGNGALKLLLAQSDDAFHIRGLAQWQGDLDPANLKMQLKEGLLAIIMDPLIGQGKQYQGIVAWEGDSLAESVANYFKYSEQLPTQLWLTVNDKEAVGLLLQSMPREAENKAKIHSEEWDTIIKLTSKIQEKDLLTKSNEELIRFLYPEEEVRLFEPAPVNFRCTCSFEKSENALLLLGKQEVEEELQGKEKIIVTCDFCNREFEFDKSTLKNLFSQGGSSGSSTLQ